MPSGDLQNTECIDEMADTLQVDVRKELEASPHRRRVKHKHLLGMTFLKTYHIVCRIVCTLTMIVQCALIDYYLVVYHQTLWPLWIVADAAVIALFTVMFVISYRYLRNRSIVVMPTAMENFLGELPLSYISWFVYSVLLSVKICILYAPPDCAVCHLDEKIFFGPNMLRTAFTLSTIVLYLIILTSHDSRTQSPQNNFIVSVAGTVYIDVMDTTQFIGALHDDVGVVMKYNLHYFMLAAIAFNFVLPTEAIIVLSKRHFGKMPVSNRNQMLHKTIYFTVVNLPMFVLRMLIWHLQGQNVSVFLIKNILAIGLAIKDLHEFSLEVTDVIREEFHLPIFEFADHDETLAGPGTVDKELEEA